MFSKKIKARQRKRNAQRSFLKRAIKKVEENPREHDVMETKERQFQGWSDQQGQMILLFLNNMMLEPEMTLEMSNLAQRAPSSLVQTSAKHV